MEAPCQDGEGFGEWFEILLKIRRTKVVGIWCRVNPASGAWGDPPLAYLAKKEQAGQGPAIISVRDLSPDRVIAVREPSL